MIDELQVVSVVECHLRVLWHLRQKVHAGVNEPYCIDTQGCTVDTAIDDEVVLGLKDLGIGWAVMPSIRLSPYIEFIVRRRIGRKPMKSATYLTHDARPTAESRSA